MKHELPARIIDISEEDLWGSLHVPDRPRHADLLERAIDHGRSGRKAKAYCDLADYHRHALADVWKRQCTDWRKDGPADDATIADLLANRIAGWQTTTVDFGKTIDWSTRAFGDSGLCGFHYMGWIAPAVRRVALTAQLEVARWLSRTIRSAYDSRFTCATHPSLHPIYYELGARAKIVRIPNAYLAILHRGEGDPAFVEAVMKLVLGCARSLHTLQTRYRGGNWQIAGCGALIEAASLFPEFTEAGNWLKAGLRYQRQHLERDFFADGCHSERSFGYMHMSLISMLRPLLTAQRIGGYGRQERLFRTRLRRSYRWLAKAVGPAGLHPSVGDCHFGSALPWLQEARALFNGSDDAYLGVDRSASYYFKPSGFAAMRNGDRNNDCYALATFGPWAGWHSHMDTGSLSFYALGKPLIEECGRFGGYDNPLSFYLRTPECHNMVTIDGAHFDPVQTELRRAQDTVWRTTPDFDFLTFVHRAYRHQPAEPQSPDAVVRRTVLLVKNPGYLFVFDSVLQENSRNPIFTATQNWHSPFPFEVLNDHQARTRGRTAVLLTWARSEWLRRLEPGIDYAGTEIVGEEDYRERYSLRARRWADIGYDGAIGFATVLVPFRGPVPDIDLTPIAMRGGQRFRAEGFEIRHSGGTDTIILNPERLPDASWNNRRLQARALVRTAGKRRATVIG